MRIEIDMEDYLDLLREIKRQREEYFSRFIPECVWEYTLELIEDCGVDPKNANPKDILDNIIVNGDYRPYDEVREDDETDEELEERLKDDVMAFVGEGDDKYVIYSL